MTMKSLKTLITTTFVALLALGQQACDLSASELEKVKSSGELVMVTRNAATTYYEGPTGEPAGLEYVLAKMFAERLGVELKVEVANSIQGIFTKVVRHDAHFAAAGLTVTSYRQNWVRFTHPYQTITQQVVYLSGTRRPRNVLDLNRGNLEVIANSSHAERLRELKVKYPQLHWTETNELETEELLENIRDHLLSFTVVDSNEFQINRRYYPELRIAFTISEPQPVAWAFPISTDNSLYDEAQRFFEEIRENGTLDQLIEEHFSHVEQFDFVATPTFLKHIADRLPKYEELFKKVSQEHDIDWMLAVAIAYQESHLRANAISPTGVRGMMMLTRRTARELGVKDRTDPTQSIEGGIRYFRKMMNALPPEIQGEDRYWFALAAYNVGLGHLNDARDITRRRGMDPDKWVDVKDNLPLLRIYKWYRRTKHGYARGNEPVKYVENIRSYYEILHRELTPEEEEQAPTNIDLPAL
jgi:membrane-bound lytic murein transglycosylase F